MTTLTVKAEPSIMDVIPARWVELVETEKLPVPPLGPNSIDVWPSVYTQQTGTMTGHHRPEARRSFPLRNVVGLTLEG